MCNVLFTYYNSSLQSGVATCSAILNKTLHDDYHNFFLWVDVLKIIWNLDKLLNEIL